MGDANLELDELPHVPGLSFGGLIDDQELEKRDDRRLVAELTPIFNAVDRVLTMMRVYPPTHPLVDELIRGLVKRVEPVLEQEGAVLFQLDADMLSTTSGSQFYSRELSEKGQFLWYAPYSDGVLQVEFLREVTADEMRGFLRVINKAAQGLISSDDDTVTLLWELQLAKVKYFAVEGFVDSGKIDDFGERTEQEAIDLIVDAAITPGGDEAKELHGLFENLNLTHLDLFTRMQIEANAKILAPEMRDQDLAYAFAVAPELVDKLGTEWSAGTDLEYRLIEALLSIIRTAPASAGAQRAAEIIAMVTRQLLDAEMFLQAVRVLELLHDRRSLFLNAEFDPLGELLEELSDPMQIEALLNIFQAQASLRESIGRLFKLLGPQKVLRQLQLLLADEKRTIVALEQIVDVAIALAEGENEALITASEFMNKPAYLRRVMTELPDRDYLAWRPTSRFIRKAIDSSDPEVRELGLRLKHPCWEDPSLAKDYLVPMADDPDERIRKLALELLAEKHPQMFREVIRDTLLAKRIGDRAPAELRFLMRIFLESSPDAAPFLRSLLDTRGWFGESSREFAKMAAAVLLEAGDAEVTARLAAAQKSMLTSPELKRAYEQVLQRFGGKGLAETSASDVSERRS